MDHRVFVRDLVLACSIGVHDHERRASQRVRINIDLDVASRAASADDSLANVVDYERVVDGARRFAREGHINLVETLAERIARFCLEDARVLTARVRVEKIDVFPDAAAVGVEIIRGRDTA
ncbi:MAG: dihydroneopterin aldolase [Alphaproteobacteria bacterium]|nr:dihydroneopterin aldolase [Alphaproteobacteria bacterium]